MWQGLLKGGRSLCPKSVAGANSTSLWGRLVIRAMKVGIDGGRGIVIGPAWRAISQPG